MNSTATTAQVITISTDGHPCACSSYANAETGERIECHRNTKRTFAPGHDAKLKGFLIRLGAAGTEVRDLATGQRLSAMQVANRYGFGYMVADGIERTSPRPAKVEAKVGRWTYTGVVEGDTFHYNDRKDVVRSTTKFTLV